MRIFFIQPAFSFRVSSVLDAIPNDARYPFLFTLEYVNNILTLLDILEQATELEDQEFQNDMELNF